MPGCGSMWSLYLRLLETHEGEEIKDLETVPGEWTELKSFCAESVLRGIRTRDGYEHSPIESG